jgi:hypothetical protein
LYRDAALADGRSPPLRVGVSLLEGVIRVGGPADFSLVHGDPLSDPTALRRVWRVA